MTEYVGHWKTDGESEPCQICEAPTDRRTSVSEVEDGYEFKRVYTFCDEHDTDETLAWARTPAG